METVKYICEFFFCNFWHWLGLCLVLMSATRGFQFVINNKNDKND